MKKIEAIIKPFRVEKVRKALEALHLVSITVTEVRDFSQKLQHVEIYRGTEYTLDFLPRLSVVVIVPDELKNVVVKAITDSARTENNKTDDGQIFITPVEEVIEIHNFTPQRAEMLA